MQSTLPETISTWPTLPSSLSLASIQSPSKLGTQPSRPGEELDEVDNANTDSILAIANDIGHIHYFLDGAYPMGYTSMGEDLSVVSLTHSPRRSTFFAHVRSSHPDVGLITRLRPSTIELTLLGTRHPRDVAHASSAARELVWYAMCVVREMRESWFGSNIHVGARELGPKWLRALERRQTEQFGRKEVFFALHAYANRRDDKRTSRMLCWILHSSSLRVSPRTLCQTFWEAVSR